VGLGEEGEAARFPLEHLRWRRRVTLDEDLSSVAKDTAKGLVDAASAYGEARGDGGAHGPFESLL
jgi:hypothetical protein